MLYTVVEISKKLSISRQAIYKKIEKITELKSHIKTKNNVKYIDEIGLDIIKMSIDNSVLNTDITDFNNKNEEIHLNKSGTTELTSSQDLFVENYIKNLEHDKRKLFEELNVKNNQIKSLTEALNCSQKLNENNQILLRESQQKVLLLEKSKIAWWKKIF